MMGENNVMKMPTREKWLRVYDSLTTGTSLSWDTKEE